MIEISVIIPYRNTIDTLLRLLDSIPASNEIEVLVVDNNGESPLKKEDVPSSRDFTLLYSKQEVYAGGARNIGLDNAKGEWVIFADADDYFCPDAFTQFLLKKQSSADIIYFKSKSIANNTNFGALRGEKYSSLVSNYASTPSVLNGLNLRIHYIVSWAKMIRRQYIIENHFRFDEIASGNDINFSLKTALHTEKIEAVDEYVYVVTESPHSLSKRREYPYVSARYKATLQANKYLREHNLSQYQRSIMYNFLYCCRYGLRPAFRAVRLMWQYRQNPFIGWRNWWGTVKRLTSH